ncbi:FtsW/RodA/SpoVE family cell cycle protein [Halochromatium glycolicum]|uniref:Cell cycle protein n=1 Tax=Halochromatium glycolicum TaxID=85075 RepID=A0AAJ0U3W7_9GAMM|nr:FtsW/RodA/SpoVE family cell cycle protein [Halochromatium glycolicum]MBK1704828.1 cell cycle protein [Halochromatium glycolicum]
MAAKGTPTTAEETWALRRPERRLLLSALMIALLGYLMLLGARPKDGFAVQLADWAPLLVFAAAFGAVHGAFVIARFRGDQLVLPTTALLSAFGLLAQVRMGLFGETEPDWMELVLLPVALAALVLVALAGRAGRYAMARRATWFWAGLSLLILGVLLVTGQRFRGAVYAVGFITPTELLKLTLVLFTAGFIDQHLKALSRWRSLLPPLRRLWPLLLVWGLVTALLLMQRDLGLVLILGVALLVMLVAGTGQPGYAIYGLALAAGAGAALISLFSHGQRRLAVWLDPFADPTGAGWQVLQGLSGMFAGGLWGEGFSEARPRYAPIAESDFIYSVLAEELGYVGSLLLIAVFAVLFIRLLTLAARARTPFGLMVTIGITSVLAVQTLLNLGGVTKALPLTGITLPMISHGGSSLVTVFASLGLVLAISDGEPVKPRAKATAVKKTKTSSSKAPAGGKRRAPSSRAKAGTGRKA